ncbi:zinc ribbon domain-containing protein [Candidatus Bathyarchaeota archaeon]|nr:zinc ribbon domain-containing protein [Candidatus Bathyarchaeota archaeon]
MKGAIVFLTVFMILLAATLSYSDIPPGKEIYRLLEIPETAHPVVGIPATILVYAVLNAVVYGIAAWLIFTIAEMSHRRRSMMPSISESPRAAVGKKFCINCGTEIIETAKYCRKCGASQSSQLS